MPCGNQDSNLGSLFAEHEVFALKKKNKTNIVTSSTPPKPPSSLLITTKLTFFFLIPQKGIFRSVLSNRLAIYQVILKLADHNMASEKTLFSPN